MAPKTKLAFRRCHVCGKTCESPEKVIRCQHCGKPFAPFFYYEDEFAPVPFEGGLRPMNVPGQWRPIQGLTAYWHSD